MPSLTSEQRRNASIIIQVGRQVGASARDIQIALITAMQESGLRNLRYGDRDSQGLFQQRPSMAWGSIDQVTDPSYAARAFFLGAGSNQGLLDLDNRGGMSMTQAAQAVQRSAYPDAYAKHIPLIRSAWPSLQRTAGEQPVDMDGLPYGGIGGVTGGETFTPGINPDWGEEGTDLTDFAGHLVNAPQSPSLTATAEISPLVASSATPALAASPGAVPQDEDLELFTSPLRYLPGDEFAAATGAGYGTKGMNASRRAIVEEARNLIGTPYVWGGTTPDGFDCSGFVAYVFSRMGIELPRVSYQQANAGPRIPLQALAPGDLVAWDNSSRNRGADHIAIYIGNGKVIESPRPGIGVRVRELGRNEGAWGVKMNL